MMHYWTLLWDWNTLDSVRAIHSFLEVSALTFFALLVLFDVLAHVYAEHVKRAKQFERVGLWFFGVAVLAEILAYPYSRRNDELSENVIVSLSGLAGTADQKARQALGDSSTAIAQSRAAVDDSSQARASASGALTVARGARQEADTFENDIKTARTEAADALANLADAKRLAEDAQKGTAVLAQAALPRRLSEERKTELARALSRVPVFSVVFEAARSGSKEVSDFTDDLIDVFKRLKLMPPGSSASNLDRAIGASEPRGVIIGVMGNASTEHPRAADVLLITLKGWGIEASGETAPNVAKTATEIHILIGAKQ